MSRQQSVKTNHRPRQQAAPLCREQNGTTTSFSSSRWNETLVALNSTAGVRQGGRELLAPGLRLCKQFYSPAIKSCHGKSPVFAIVKTAHLRRPGLVFWKFHVPSRFQNDGVRKSCCRDCDIRPAPSFERNVTDTNAYKCIPVVIFRRTRMFVNTIYLMIITCNQSEERLLVNEGTNIRNVVCSPNFMHVTKS